MDRLEAILETALYAADLDAAEAFYAGILGLEVLGRQPGRHVFFKVGAGVLLVFNPEETIRPPAPGAALAIPPHGTHGPGHACFRLSAEHFGAWRQKLAAAGIAIEAEVDWPQGGHSLYLRDPAGNSIEFAEARIWGL